MAADFAGVIGVLADAGVEVIVIGGLAAQAHGSARLTQDADFIYRRSPENLGSRPRSRHIILTCAERQLACRFASTSKPFAAVSISR